jgi:hypothetical protein
VNDAAHAPRRARRHHRAWQKVRALAQDPIWLPLALAVGVLLVYYRTLAPGALGGDAGELQFVPYILSMPHPTGTPLYVLLGKPWSLLPLGPSVAWRMNLLAAVSATGAVLTVYASVRLRAKHPAPALGAALSLAFGLTFWEQALMADKYAFNALMVGLVLFLALRWGETRSPGALNALVVVYGLSLAHHRTMALMAPLLLGYIWWCEGRALWRDSRRLGGLAWRGAVPLLLYLYLPWAETRGLPPGTWRPASVSDWLHYLLDSGRTHLVYIDPTILPEALLFFLRTLQRDVTWIGVLLGSGGLVLMLRRRPAQATFLLAVFAVQGFLAANHHVPRHWVYFIPSFLIFALWIGEGLDGLWQAAHLLPIWASRTTHAVALSDSDSARRQDGRLIESDSARILATAGAGALMLGMLVWPLAPFMGRYRPLREAHLGAGTLDVWRQTLKQGHMADRLGAAIALVEPDATIVGDWEQSTPLWYYQQVEGLRPDVRIVYPIERLENEAQRTRPLYLARAHGGIAERWHPTAQGPLLYLQTSPNLTLPASLQPLGLRFTREGDDTPLLELAGFALGQASFAPPTVVPITLYWRAHSALDHDYAVSLRLLRDSGEGVYQVDTQHPVLGTYPTSRWTPGEVVADYYELPLSRELTPGPHHWAVVVYRSLPEGGWESLVQADAATDLAIGGQIDVHP